MVQPGASDREITHAAADAAELAFDRVADAELAHRQSTEGSLSDASPSYAVSDAVLDQRTYFVPTMVSTKSCVLRCLDLLHRGTGLLHPCCLLTFVILHLLGGGSRMLWRAASPQRAHMMCACADVKHVAACMQAAYIGGLGIAFAANAITHMGQPALLYLVPATCGTIFLMAAGRGELGRLLSFVDSPTPAAEKAADTAE